MGDAGWRELRGPTRRARAATDFGRLTATHALAMAGDTLITLALAGSLFFSISPSAARGRVALSLLFTMAPFAVVAPFLGPAIDRSSRGRKVMVVGSCVARAGACLVMARVIDGLWLFPAAFGVLVFSKAYSVAKSALVPSLVAAESELVEANAKLAITGVVAGFLAAGPGISVLRLLDGVWVLRLAAIVFACAAISGFRLDGRDESGPDEARSAGADEPAVAASSAAVASRGRSDLRLAAAAVVMALLRAEVGFLTFLVAFGFRRAGAPSWWFGLVLASSMAASLAGSAIAPRLRERFSEEQILASAIGLVALVGIGVARLEGRLLAALVAGAVGIAAGAGKLAFDSLVQRDSPEAARGRSFARYEAGFQLVWVVGALLPVVIATPLRQGYDVLGVASLLGAVAYVLASRRLGTTTSV